METKHLHHCSYIRQRLHDKWPKLFPIIDDALCHWVEQGNSADFSGIVAGYAPDAWLFVAVMGDGPDGRAGGVLIHDSNPPAFEAIGPNAAARLVEPNPVRRLQQRGKRRT